MKHWGVLTDLETEIIRVGEFKNLFKLLVSGVENDTDIKVLQSAIYTLEGMIDDIDSTLYEKFQTVWDSVKFEVEDMPEPASGDTMQTVTVPAFNLSNYDTITIHLNAEDKSSTVQNNSTSEEDEAFRELEKAMKNWHKATP